MWEDKDSIIEKSGDDIDKANALAEIHNVKSVQAAMLAARPQQVPNADGTYRTTKCKECDDEIPPERLKLGRILCVICQTDLEQRQNRGRR